MIAGINTVSGRTDCSEAVILQQRHQSATAASFVALVIIMLAVQFMFEPGTLVTAVIAAILVTAGMMLVTTTYWLGYCDGDLLLVKTNKMQNKATELTAQYTYPVEGAVTSGSITKKVTVAGVDYLMSRQFEQRLRSITGI